MHVVLYTVCQKSKCTSHDLWFRIFYSLMPHPDSNYLFDIGASVENQTEYWRLEKKKNPWNLNCVRQKQTALNYLTTS